MLIYTILYFSKYCWFADWISLYSVGKLENGKYNPSLKLAMDIAKVFGKPVEDVFEFFDDEDDED